MMVRLGSRHQRTVHLRLVLLALLSCNACDRKGTLDAPQHSRSTQVADAPSKTAELIQIAGLSVVLPDFHLASTTTNAKLVWRLLYQESLRVRTRDLEHEVAVERRRLTENRNAGVNWSAQWKARGESKKSIEELLNASAAERVLVRQAVVNRDFEPEVLAEYQRVAPLYVSQELRIQAAEIITADVDSPEERKKAEALRERLQGDVKTFHEYAKAHSRAKSAKQSGSLGVFTKDSAPQRFPREFFDHKPGSVSPVVAHKDGLYLFMIEAVYQPGPLPLEALRERLTARVTEQRLEKERSALRREVADHIMHSNIKDESLSALGVRSDHFRETLDKAASPFPSGWEL